MDKVTEFTIKNFKSIMAILAFLIGIYIQHQANTAEIKQLEERQNKLAAQMETNVQRLDQIKLDKAVFDQTLRQFSSMSDDIREIRNRLDDVLEKQSK